MTIKEIRSLIRDEDLCRLRNPKTLNGKTAEETKQTQDILAIIVNKVIENPNRKHFLDSMSGKCIMRKCGIKKIKNTDPEYGIHEINSVMGEGMFFDSHRLFPDGKYPNYIQPGFCYSNAYGYVLTHKVNSKIVSGIAHVGKPFLHSVIVTNSGMVVDFNYNVVMTAELYFQLTNFEILAELDSHDVWGIQNLCLEHGDLFEGFQSYEINFAFEEVMANIRKKLNNGNVEVD